MNSTMGEKVETDEKFLQNILSIKKDCIQWIKEFYHKFNVILPTEQELDTIIHISFHQGHINPSIAAETI
jgi:hypothetical protein